MNNIEIVRAYDAVQQLSEKISILDSTLADMREASDAQLYDPALIYSCLLDLEECRREFTRNQMLLYSSFAGLVRAFKSLQNEYIDLFIKEVTPEVAQPVLNATLRTALIDRYLHHLTATDQDRFMWLFMGMYKAELPVAIRDAVRAILAKAVEAEAEDYRSEGLV